MPDYLIAWLHLLAAVTLIGGLVFSQFVLAPVCKDSPADPAMQRVRHRSGRRFRTLAWASLIVLILTGAYQILQESGSARIETIWGVVLMFKLFLFAVAFGLLLIHDFIIDPHGPASPASQPPARADLLQKAALLTTLVILLMASYLSRL